MYIKALYVYSSSKNLNYHNDGDKDNNNDLIP